MLRTLQGQRPGQEIKCCLLQTHIARRNNDSTTREPLALSVCWSVVHRVVPCRRRGCGPPLAERHSQRWPKRCSWQPQFSAEDDPSRTSTCNFSLPSSSPRSRPLSSAAPLVNRLCFLLRPRSIESPDLSPHSSLLGRSDRPFRTPFFSQTRDQQATPARALLPVFPLLWL